MLRAVATISCFVWLGALSCILATPALAGQQLLAPTAAVRAGEEIRVDLLITNEGDAPLRVTPPQSLPARLLADERAQNLTLVRGDPIDSAEIELAPQSFRRIAYAVRLPADYAGAVTLRPDDREVAPVMFAIAAGDTPASAAPSSAAGSAASAAIPAAAAPAPLSRDAAFLAAFSGYEPIYFAAGPREDWNAKFQVSFKFRFFNDEAELARHFHVLEHLYLGYTQTSLWDLGSPSSPFRDTSYKPRLFYSDPESWHMRDFPLRLGFEGGLGHESNGRGGNESRSINTLYLRPALVIGAPGDWQWTLAPTFVDYLNADNNPDISDYRGYVDLYSSIGKADSWQLAAMVRKGEGGRWTSQLDLTYPLRSVALGNLNGYLLLQFFDGWGESILDYNQRFPAQYRLGLMFVR